MGLAVPFLPNSPQQKQTQEFLSEKEECNDIGDGFTLAEEFSTILAQSQQSAMNRKVPFFCCRRSPYSRNTLQPPPNALQTWNQVLSHRQLLPRLLNFMTTEDLVVLKGCSRSLRRLATSFLLKKESNWSLTMSLLSPYLLRQTHLRESNFSDEYQHSQDLDRTSGYFQSENEESLTQNRMKLDRIITTISFQIRYFQGIMPICAALLQCFDETVSFWVLKYLLFRCRYIQNDIDFYTRFLLELQDEFKLLLPHLHQHLSKLGFQLNYFVMKWVMGLFSEDLPKQMLLILWDLLCQTDVYIFTYVIIQIFKLFEQELLGSQDDAINELLKVQLKWRLSQVDGEELMRRSKQLYILRRLDIG